MTGPTFRQAARFFFEPPLRSSMAHRDPVDQAHRAPKPEPLWLAVVVLLVGLAGFWFLVTIVLAAVPV